VARQSESERLASEARSDTERHNDLFRSASVLLTNLYDELSNSIMEAAPSVKQYAGGGKRNGKTFNLGTAQLELVPIGKTPTNPWEWEPPAFDVIAQAGVILRIPRDRYDFEGRSHSLWYCYAFEAGRYEWIETAFMITPLSSKSTIMRPFMADPGIEAAKSLWNGMAEFQLAWPLETVETDTFIDRWSNWFADAAQGRLHPP